LTVRELNQGGGQVQRGFVDDELHPTPTLDSSSSISSSRAFGLTSVFWAMGFLLYRTVLAVKRLLVVEAEMGQVQSRLVVDEPQPGLHDTSSSSISSSRALGLTSVFWAIGFLLLQSGAFVLPIL